MSGPRLIRLVFGLGVVAALALAVWRPTAAGQANQRPVMVAALAFSPDGKQFLTAGDDKLARVWDAVGFKQVRAFAGHADPVNAVAFSPDGKRVVTGSGDPLSPDRKRFGRDRDGNWVQYGQWAPNPRSDNTARVWDASSGEQLLVLRAHILYLTAVAVSPDGKLILTASADRTTRLWDAATGAQVRELKGHLNPVRSVVFSPDSAQALTATQDPTHDLDHTARLWDVDTGKRVRGFQGTRRWSAAVAFSRDGQEVYAGAFAWDAETGEQLSPAFLKHPQVVSVVGFSPDGKQVLTGGSDGTARLFEAASGKELHAFRGSGPARAVAFSPDGTRVLTADADGTVRLWDARAGTELQRFFAYRDGTGSAAPPNP